jgi:hypothetical protein
MKRLHIFSFIVIVSAYFSGCDDQRALGQSSFAYTNGHTGRAGPTSVISMGRDDDDGMAEKWDIGGFDYSSNQSN